ncbi:MAG: hypothetical protein HEQ32_00050 [Vampirovibrio sp.]
MLSPIWTLSTLAADEKDKRKAAPPTQVEALADGSWQYTFAIGTTFVSSLEAYISTQTNQVNDTFTMRTIHDVWVNNQKTLPKGTRFYGRIEAITPPIQGRNAILKIKAYALETLGGEVIPLEGTLFANTEDAGVEGGEVTQPMNGRLVRYEIMGLGMINRVMPEGPRAMGVNQILSTGQLLRVRLDAPLQLRLFHDE